MEADIFLNLSEVEGFCIAVAEAMLGGLPVIAVDVGGIRDYGRGDENMLKLPRRMPKATRAAILRPVRRISLARTPWSAGADGHASGTTLSHAGSRWRRRFHRHDGERCPTGLHAPRIVMVLPAYLPESFGGAEQQTRRLAQTLTRRGAAVTLLAPRLEGRTPARERKGRSWYGASVCVKPRISVVGTSIRSCGGVFASPPGCGETDVAL